MFFSFFFSYSLFSLSLSLFPFNPIPPHSFTLSSHTLIISPYLLLLLLLLLLLFPAGPRSFSRERAREEMESEIRSTIHDGQSAAVQAAIRRRLEKKYIKICDKVAAVAEAEQAAKDAQDEARSMKAKLASRLDAWEGGAGSRKDIRGLLANLHTVLWEGHRWKTVNMAQLFQAKRLKIAYHKAILVVHPDRVDNDVNATAEMKFIAERVFHVINKQYKAFEQGKT